MTHRLIMRLGRERYAMDVAQVVSTAPAGPVVPLPRAASMVEGLATYGSDVVPQIGLAAMVGQEAPSKPGAYVTLARTASGLLALRHDGFDGVREFPDGLLAPVAAPAGDCRTGMIRLAGRRVYAIDAGRIRLGGQDAVSHVTASGAGEMPIGASRPAQDQTEGAKVMLVRRGGEEFGLVLDLIERVERSATGSPRLILRSARGRAALDVDAVLGFGADGEETSALLDLTSPAVMSLTWSETPGVQADPAAEQAVKALPVLRLEAGELACLVRRRDVQFVMSGGYLPAPWVGSRFDGLLASGRGILPAFDLSRRLGGQKQSGRMTVILENGGTAWAVACDRISDGGTAVVSQADVTWPWASAMFEAQDGPVPLFDLDRFLDVVEAA